MPTTAAAVVAAAATASSTAPPTDAGSIASGYTPQRSRAGSGRSQPRSRAGSTIAPSTTESNAKMNEAVNADEVDARLKAEVEKADAGGAANAGPEILVHEAVSNCCCSSSSSYC